MVARVQTHSGGLLVVFYRDGEEPHTTPARDGMHAALMAMAEIARRNTLLVGDTVTVRRADERPEPDDQPPTPDLPAHSRSSHYS